MEKKLTVLLGWRALLQLSRSLGLDGAQRGQAAAELGAGRGGGRIRRERAADSKRRRFESEQCVLGLYKHRGRGHLGGYRIVAIAIASNPAAEAKERGREGRAHAGIRLTERAIELAIDLRHDTKQRFIENGHRRADLIQRCDLRSAQLTGSPKRVDLLGDPAHGLAALAIGRPRILEPAQLLPHTTDGCDHRTAPCLGRVGREDGVHLEAGEHFAQPTAAQSFAQRGHGRRQRFGHRSRSAVAFAQDPSPMVLLSQVDQVEVDGKCASHLLGSLERPGRHDLLGPALVNSGVARANDRPAQRLDVLQERSSAVFLYYLSENLAQHSHVAAERIWDRLPRGGSGIPSRPARCASGATSPHGGEAGQAFIAAVRDWCAYSNESSRAASDASMMLLEQPTVVHRFDPLPDSTSTRVVAAVPAAPSRMRTL